MRASTGSSPRRRSGSARGSRPGAPATRAGCGRSSPCARSAGQRREQGGTARIRLDEAERSGRLVVEAQGVDYAWDDKPVIKGLDTLILRGDKIGIIGPNGAGKTTLLKLLLGEIAPQAGQIRRGTNLQVAYFDQLRAQLDETSSVQDNVAGGSDQVEVGGQPRHVLSYLKDFLFSPGAGPPAGLRPLRRRAQPPAAGQALHPPGQPAGPGRAHQRPGRRDPGAAGRAAARLPGDHPPGQPRPRPARQRGHQHPGPGGRGAGAGLCRRLHATGCASATPRRRSSRPQADSPSRPRPQPRPAGRARRARGQAELQGGARTGRAARRVSRPWRPSRANSRPASPTPASTSRAATP